MFRVGDRVKISCADSGRKVPYGVIIRVLDNAKLFPYLVHFDGDHRLGADWYNADEMEHYVNGVERMIECLK